MSYYNSIEVVYKVIGSVIYSFIDDLLCRDYMGIVQRNLSALAYDNCFEKLCSIIFMGWVFLKF